MVKANTILNNLPRTRLALLPTPIMPLPRLSQVSGGPQLFIKRDDQTGLATGGNKTRKLEFLIAQALERGATCVITAGSTQSNHARQTAAAARASGLEPHLVLYAPGGNPPEQLRGNLLINRLLGAEIHWTEEKAPYVDTIELVETILQNRGEIPYVIPYGGSNAYGLLGYVDAMVEAAEQATEDAGFDAHVFASSSGGTQAGMVLGAHLAGLLDKTSVIGISVDEQEDVLKARVAALVNAGAELLKLDWQISSDNSALHVNADYLGGGYAVVGAPEQEAIQLLAQHEGILVDPVYTGRALAGLIDMVRQGQFSPAERVLFWHTGGAAALFAFEHALGLG